MKRKYSIIVIDDEPSLLENIEIFLGEEYDLSTFSNPSKALENMQSHKYDLLITDYKMPGLSGVDLLLEARQKHAYAYGILLTAYGDMNLLEDALNKKLVSRYIEKPLKLKILKAAVEEGLLEVKKQEETQNLVGYKEKYFKLVEQISDQAVIGIEGGLKEVKKKVESVAPFDVPVLLTGETGTGKEVIARLIHSLSERKENNFIAVNCAAIPEALLESELFGHSKGAFTGAVADKEGKIALAHKGTLFLDEIGEMKSELQSKILRVLQDKEITPLGSLKMKESNFRLIAATNKDLEKAIENKEFREDLFYRINTFPIHLPSLNQRPQDIPPLVNHYLKVYCKEMNLKPLPVTDEAMGLLEKYNWKGNIRELKNTIQRALIVGMGQKALTSEEFEFLFAKNTGPLKNSEHVFSALRDLILGGKVDLKDVEKNVINNILIFFNNNVKKASEITGISEAKFYRAKK